MKPPPQDVLRDDYARTLDVYKALVDVRFRLLVLVPGATAVATGLVGLVGKNDPAGAAVGVAAAAIALAVLGLVATCGVIIYEIRNSHLHDAVVHRLRFLEIMLGLPQSTFSNDGGMMNERPQRPRLLGFIELWHDRALSIVYGASIGAWTWLLLTSPSPIPGLLNKTFGLNVDCTNGKPVPLWWEPTCRPYTPPLVAILLGLLTARVVIVMSRVNRPPATRTAVIPEPGADPLVTVKNALTKMGKRGWGARETKNLTKNDAKIVSSLGFGAIRKFCAFSRFLRLLLRVKGCALADDGKRTGEWIKTTKAGREYVEKGDDDQKAKLSKLLEENVLFYTEMGEWKAAGNPSAEALLKKRK